MNKRQNVALDIMQRVVAANNGDIDNIRMVGNSYRWTTPDGKEASVEWRL